MLMGPLELQVVVPGAQEVLVAKGEEEVVAVLLLAAGAPAVPGQVLGEEGLLWWLFGFGPPELSSLVPKLNYQNYLIWKSRIQIGMEIQKVLHAIENNPP
ncbi:UNVERIFIED_CONTAM: hypothetical protein K2H54_053911 [Gekko kuhli]